MSDCILTCNAGSASLKCALYEAAGLDLRYRFTAEHIYDEPHHALHNAAGEALYEGGGDIGYSSALHMLLDWLHEEETDISLVAVGHRIVHGGQTYDKAVLVTGEVLNKLEALEPLAPLHQPHNLALIDIIEARYPGVKQVGCFDTAFHRSQPWVAQQFALPRELTEQEGILRYGFHGLSYEYIAQTLPDHSDKVDGRVVVAHLGGGASMCAMKGRKSVATTMGFTALDGLMMGSRSGDLDPGVILYLLQQKKMPARKVEELLYKQSGILGVSGISSDMRDLHASDRPEAKQAIDLFCYIAARQLGSLITVIGGLDVLVFTGAMGCNDAHIRAKICEYLAWMGVAVGGVANTENQICISTSQSSAEIYALPTDEEMIIASHTAALL